MTRALLVLSTLSTLALSALVLLALRVPTWDYKIAAPNDVMFDVDMTQLGTDGWEVVTCRRAMGSDLEKTAAYECIFKRPR